MLANLGELEGVRLLSAKLVQTFKHVSVQQVVDRIETVDLSETVSDVIDLYAIEGRRAGMVVRLDDRLDPASRRWTGYPGHLGQVLLNLLSNGERYAYPAGGGPLDVVLAAHATPSGPGFALTVADHGRGIPEADRSRIFEPFFTTGRGRGGTGLGLAIVHNLVTSAMGGTITLISEVGVGTSVTVTLPNLVEATMT